MSDVDRIIEELNLKKKNYDSSYISKQFTLDDIINEYKKTSSKDNETEKPLSYDENRVATDKGIYRGTGGHGGELLHSREAQVVLKEADIQEEIESKAQDNEPVAADTIDFITEDTDTIKRDKHSISLFEEEDDDEPPLNTKKKAEEPEIEDYNNERDAADIKRDLILQKRGLFFKTFIAALISFMLLYINLAGKYGLYLPSVISTVNPEKNIFTFGFANALLTFLLILVCFNTVISGFASFIRLRFYNDTLPAVAIIAALIHSIVIAFSGSSQPVLYNGAAALSIFFSMLGKYFFVSNVEANFSLIAKNSHLLACEPIREIYSLRDLYKDSGDVCVTRPVKIVTDFLENSFCNDPSENASSKIGKISFVIILLTGVLAGIMRGRSAVIPSLAAVTAISASFVSELAFAMPFFKVSKRARKSGGVLIGYNAAECFDNAETLILKDTDLFPKDNALIYSMKITDKSRIDEIILNAASLMSCTDGPLSEAFVRILDKREGMLKEVTDFNFYENRGISGIIDGRRIFAGNSVFLNSCGIELPKEDYEVKYGRGGKSVLMFGSEGKVTAVFVVGYGISEEFSKVIKRLDSSSFTLGVLTKDNNITETLIETKYDLVKTPVVIPGKNEAQIFEECMRPSEKLSAYIVSCRGAAGICTALDACQRAKSAVKACIWLRTAGIITGGLLLMFLCIISEQPIEPLKIILFQLLWMIPFGFTVIFKSK